MLPLARKIILSLERSSEMFNLLSAKGNLLQHLKTDIRIQKPCFLVSNVHNRPTSNHNPLSNPAIDFILNEVAQDFEPLKPHTVSPTPQKSLVENEEADVSSRVQISHPWPEWVELMEKLLKGGYFDQIGHPFGRPEMGSKDVNQIRTACLNFARHRFDLIRSLSRKDIQIIAGSGCPSIDRKVVNSGKRLRAHVGIDEGNVCSSCILRGNCERAYVKAHKDEGGRTVDVMRFLVTYGLDAVIGSVNKPYLKKNVKESVRKLLKEVAEFSTEELRTEQLTAASSKWSALNDGTAAHRDQINTPMRQGNWTCPKCNFLNFARNVKCLHCGDLFQEKLRKLNEELDHLLLKKGDWICNKCNFLNFAKNTRCLQCKEKPAERQLNPGEWECESCNYINFKRNMVCLKCDHKRPKVLNSMAQASQSPSDNMHRPRTRPYFGQERQCRDVDEELTFVDGEEEDISNSSPKMPRLIEFPIIGGRSELSQNVEKQERWRREKAEQSSSAAKAGENANEFKSSIIRRSSKFLQSADDEEMAEWFGHKTSSSKTSAKH